MDFNAIQVAKGGQIVKASNSVNTVYSLETVTSWSAFQILNGD